MKYILRNYLINERPCHILDLIGNIVCKCSYGNPSGNTMAFGTFYYYIYFSYLQS